MCTQVIFSSRDRALIFSLSIYREVASVCFQWLERVLFSFFCCGAHCSNSSAQFCIEAKVYIVVNVLFLTEGKLV